jgi:acyl-CoA synthetase (NDP forming)
MVAISNSGATCVLAADAAEELNLPLAALSEATRAQLQAILPGFATTTNPIDMTGVLLSDSSLFGKTLDIAGKDPAADLFFVGFPVAGTGYDVEAFARAAADFIATTGKPLVVAVPQAEVAAPFIARGVPVFAGDRQALQALKQLAAHAALMCRGRDAAGAPPASISLTAGAGPVLNGGDEARS